MSSSLLTQFEGGVLPMIFTQEQIETHTIEILSELWAGYGYILRLHDSNDTETSRIVKLIAPPPQTSTTDEGRARKILSYHIEANFYKHFAEKACDHNAKVPTVFHDLSFSVPHPASNTDALPRECQVLVLEDLQHSFPVFTEKRGVLSPAQISKSIEWLAQFHTAFWDIDSFSTSPSVSSTREWCPAPLVATEQGWQGTGLWATGGYHYLSTRLPELSAIPARSIWSRLGLNSSSDLPFAIDWCLSNPTRRERLTLVHGDVKAANMAFTVDATDMAMYDLQYVGRGLGVQDLAKFLTTSIPAEWLEGDGERRILAEYHDILVRDGIKDYPFEDFIADWELALVSWTRFLAGWSGGFWGNVDWLQGRTRALLENKEWVERVLQRYAARTTDE